MLGYVARWPKARAVLTLAAGLIALPLLAGTAAAQPTSAQQAAIKSSCQSDFRANCSGVSPGGEAALACLQQNVAKLSAACQQAVNAASGTAAPAPAPAADTAPATKTAPATAACAGRCSTAAEPDAAPGNDARPAVLQRRFQALLQHRPARPRQWRRLPQRQCGAAFGRVQAGARRSGAVTGR